MAIFRKVHVTFWKDNFIEILTPEQRYFYLYLITNGNTTQCGIYEISVRQMCFDTGYNEETVLKLLRDFTELGKIKFSTASNEIALKNWAKYNDSTSPKVKSCIKKELKNVKDRVLIEYVYSIHTVSIQDNYSIDTHTQEEQEQEEEEEWKTTTTDFENSKRKAFTELFKRIANWDSNVIFSEVGRFMNKYPHVEPNKSGALINTWVANFTGNVIPMNLTKEEEYNRKLQKAL